MPPTDDSARIAHGRHDGWIEGLAVSASLLCLVHCVGLPLVIAALPVLSTILDVPETFHLWVLAFAIPASGIALVSGRARHGAMWPLALGAAGLASLAVGAITLGRTAGETPMTVVGSLLLAVAHYANWRLRIVRRPA